MAQFQYRASDGDGKILEGMIDAADRGAAAARLQDRGLLPLSVAAPGPQRRGLAAIKLPEIDIFRKGVKKTDLLIFTHELSTLLKAGLPLDRSLSILAELSESGEMKRVTSEVLTEVQRGKSLAEALGEHPKVFEPLYVNMVKAGEVGGILDQVLQRLTEYLESATELRDEVRSAMIYPAILLATSFGSVSILLVYVLPKFTSVFTQSGSALPTSAAILMGLSDLLRTWWWLGLLLLVGAGIGFAQWVNTERGRVTWDRMRLQMALVGDVNRKVAVSRFARTLGTLLKSGVPMLQALDIVKNVSGNVVLAEAIDEVKTGVRGGDGVAGPLNQSGVFPQLALQMISVGEETGRLDDMLVQVAEYFDKEVRSTIRKLTGMLEPVMLVVGGLVVGFVVLAMFSAIFSVNNMPL